MKTCKLLISAVAVLLACGGGAAAQSYYAGAYGGANLAHDADASVSSAPGTPITAVYNAGYAIGGFVGYDFGDGKRVEGELSYRRNGIDEQVVAGTPMPMQGDTAALALMVNGIYEFQSGSSGLTPHIGAGIGIARFSVIDAAPVGDPPTNADDTVFAYQLIAGVDYELSPTLTLFADYRLFGTANPQFKDASANDVEVEYLNSAFLIGISSSF